LDDSLASWWWITRWWTLLGCKRSATRRKMSLAWLGFRLEHELVAIEMKAEA
jgi:hypothetical protein